jgi:hypothetical protein
MSRLQDRTRFHQGLPEWLLAADEYVVSAGSHDEGEQSRRAAACAQELIYGNGRLSDTSMLLKPATLGRQLSLVLSGIAKGRGVGLLVR